MKTFEELNSLVIDWAKERNLLGNDSTKQILKTMSELGELADCHLKADEPGKIDGVGDTFVTLLIYCAQNNLNPVDCLNSVYNEIKDRKGKTLNGTFIKEETIEVINHKECTSISNINTTWK